MEQITRGAAIGRETLDRSHIIEKSESNTDRNTDPEAQHKKERHTE